MKYILTLAVIAIMSMAGNAYFLNNAHNAALVLDACARDTNTYQCHFTAVPVEAPKVVTVEAALLPPPVL